MKAMQKTFAILAFLALASQTVRHAYMLWFEPRGSVLDKYDQPVKEQITAATSLDELLRRYDAVRKQADLERQEAARKGEELSVGDVPMGMREPFKSEQILHDAITEWESRAKEIREMRFYCFIGFILFVGGLFTYRKLNRWFGITLMIAAFSEFIYWTSPTFLGGTQEFHRLLANKFALSAASLVLLTGAIWYLGIFGEKNERSR
jgi:hypothetical protein